MRNDIKIHTPLLSAWLINVIALLLFSISCQKSPLPDHPFPKYVERRQSNFTTFPDTSDGVVFLGDSLTDEARWGDIFPSLKTFNRGVGADRTEHVLRRLDAVTQGRPRVMVIMIGTNDVGLGVKPETTIANYRQILLNIQRQTPDTRVLVQSLLPRQAEFQHRIEHINKALKVMAQEMGYPYVDLYTEFLDGDGSIKDAYSNDELHLLGPGYLKWREIIEPYLLSDPSAGEIPGK